ncbi:MAG: hypothetical protein E5X74_24140 [Mesorhizobium sp.]|nr:MAG: hypothetical protein EOR74_24410 [Mesorhizobium sp.]RWM34123.1 MAG: hypothetical protein EOR75_26600 [Mesorhizobium sp.]TIO74779.1 MAG: hypothetical protein E5X75_22595 [Mesorhizobium sp.]TIO82621.1 MAG: hypothetical protein E5X74_24140 [Mesorhizobium sp.]TJV49309.1 MAG: hypothetical protein E5Y01_23960 [Mesorhizobium sp.]
MTLSRDLSDKDLTFQCPSCSLTIVKKGSWVRTVSRFRCEKCLEEVRLPYGEKLAIFHRHKHLGRGGTSRR